MSEIEMDVGVDADPPSPVLHSVIPSVFADRTGVANLNLFQTQYLASIPNPSLPSPSASYPAHPPTPPQARAFRCADCRRRFPTYDLWQAHRTISVHLLLGELTTGQCGRIRKGRRRDRDRDSPRTMVNRERPYALAPSHLDVVTRSADNHENSRRIPLFLPADPHLDHDSDSDEVIWLDDHGDAVPHVGLPIQSAKAEPQSDDELRDIHEVGAPTPEEPPRRYEPGRGKGGKGRKGHCKCHDCPRHVEEHKSKSSQNAGSSKQAQSQHGQSNQHCRHSRPNCAQQPECDHHAHSHSNEGKGEDEDESKPRYSAVGRGSKVLSGEVRANILGESSHEFAVAETQALMLGQYGGRTAGPGAHIRTVTNGGLVGWEAITAAVGARPQDAERVRQCAKGFMTDLPAMIKRGR
ncbi:hypothetical protein CcaverHIS631_0106670 [Cutaneotrichosporon cavernicola]|nr:hypothetical protein CcaverHIS631_0106670 [Cutaneotrichosporon cavernicola]